MLWESDLPSSKEARGREDQNRFNIHRLKGRVLLGSGQVKMIQGVREVFEMTDFELQSRDKQDGAGTMGKIVLIGRSITGLPWQESLLAHLQLQM